jgi:hypothetical protein
VANPNPWQARIARWERQWPRPIEELQAQAYAVLQLAYEDVTVEDAEQRRKNIHVYFTALATFQKLLEAGELERRVTALELGPRAVASNGWH